MRAYGFSIQFLTNMEEPKPPTPPAYIETAPIVQLPVPPSRLAKKLIILLIIIITGMLGFVTFLVLHKSNTIKKVTSNPISAAVLTTTPPVATTAPKVDGLQLDPNKNYGNKYADGLLPEGDSKYITSTAKKGYVYVCQANFVPSSQAGAQTRGPWFVNNNTQWDMNKKSTISGSVTWTPSLSNTVSNGKRIIVTNDLPNHHTGIFPVSKNDPARVYDANPNTIVAQSLTYTLASAPSYGTPQCMGGEVGVMTTGVALFNGFDAGGRDAGAWEVQDSCDGHPQNKGEYHYHSLSRCITDHSVSTVIGYALDGFPITGPKVGTNNFLTTDDLDVCHGIVSPIILDSVKTTQYHYVMTQDFPYSASCFRAAPTQPPGRPEH
jgi:hypothetical protein